MDDSEYQVLHILYDESHLDRRDLTTKSTITMVFIIATPGPKVIKKLMLNSTEHEISTAN